MEVSDKTTQALAAALNMRQLRQELINSNVANADTPGYKAKRLDFEEALAQALDSDGKLGMNTNNPEHFAVGSGGFASLKPTVYEDPNGEVKENGNTVDRDAEMAEMNENKIQYDAAVQLLNKKMGMLKYAITSER